MNNTKEKNVKGILLLLVIAVLVMSVAFATFSQTLNINGTVTVKTTKWDVHYDPAVYTETTGSVTATAHSTSGDNNTNFAFTVTLNKPGDFYEATISAKNFGNFDATLKAITMSSLTADQQKYLKYTVTYDGTPYTASATGLSNALAANASKDVKVRVEYLMPEASADLPTEDVTVTVTGSLAYEQAS